MRKMKIFSISTCWKNPQVAIYLYLDLTFVWFWDNNHWTGVISLSHLFFSPLFFSLLSPLFPLSSLAFLCHFSKFLFKPTYLFFPFSPSPLLHTLTPLTTTKTPSLYPSLSFPYLSIFLFALSPTLVNTFFSTFYPANLPFWDSLRQDFWRQTSFESHIDLTLSLKFDLNKGGYTAVQLQMVGQEQLCKKRSQFKNVMERWIYGLTDR